MTGFDNLRRRLSRIEADRHGTAAPTTILTDRPMPQPGEPNELAGALANWREWVDDGRARARGHVLCIIAPRLTAEEWAKRYVTPD